MFEGGEKPARDARDADRVAGRWPEVLAASLRLGLTSFGGPIAHLGYFYQDYVVRRAWLDDRAYADLVAMCQVLPGPASSQVGIAIGLLRAGYAGAVAAWVGFTLPSAVALTLFALGIEAHGRAGASGWIEGLKATAVAVVAQALVGMMRSLAPDRPRATLATASCVLSLAAPNAFGQILGLACGAVAGFFLCDGGDSAGDAALPSRVSPRVGAAALTLFVVLLSGLPLWAASTPSHAVHLLDAFFRAGSLVFGGGHVVLPLLEAAIVPRGWITTDAFMAGYGAAQAVPGPLFTFAAYLGAAMAPLPHRWTGAGLCLAAVFLPSFLLVVGVLPFWARLRRVRRAGAALKGVNAAVVGLLLAAFYDPVLRAGVTGAGDFGIAAVAFLLLTAWRAPPALVVALGAAGGASLAFMRA